MGSRSIAFVLALFCALFLAVGVMAQSSGRPERSGAAPTHETGRPWPSAQTVRTVEDATKPVPTFQELPLDADAASLTGAPAAEVAPWPANGTIGLDARADETTERPATMLEGLYRERYGSDLAGGLTQFGYDLFAPRDYTPARPVDPGDEYVLGPGDRVRMRIWGAAADLAAEADVAPDGTVDLPRLGVLQLGGMDVARADALIRREAERYFQGVHAKLSLVNVRSMEVYVVGAVETPGLHMTPLAATALDALMAAGGVSPSGSLRRIRVVREGAEPLHLDLYDLMLRGERSRDAMLQDRDVVFVDRIGPTAAVAGAVSHPGVYELHGESTAAEVLALAGGALPQGKAGDIYLRRYGADAGFAVLQLGRDELEAHPVQDGDLLEVTWQEPDWPRTVELTGHVKRPSVFEHEPGLMLSDVLPGPDGLKPGAVTDFAYLKRYDPRAAAYRVVTVPLQAAMGGRYDLETQPYDTIEILAREEFGMAEPVVLRGAVWREGNYTHSQGMRLVDLLAQGGGFRFGARPERIELTRKTFEDPGRDARRLILHYDRDPDFLLEPFDNVFVPQTRDAETFSTVTVRGEVRFPGEYTLHDGDHLSDLIERAGGFTEEAYFYGASFTSEQARVIQQKSLERAISELEARSRRYLAEQAQTLANPGEAQIVAASRQAVDDLLQRLSEVEAKGRVSIQLANLEVFRGSEQDFLLQDGDGLTIPKKPNFVTVMGSVYSPSAYLFQSHLTVADYLEKSGGPTPSADDERIYVLRANGEVMAMTGTAGQRDDLLEETLMPGDTVVVPEDLERVPYLRLVKDITDILFKIATTAGVVVALL